MAVAELYINQLDPETVTLDFSPGIARLANPDTAYGFAYAKTLEHLGFTYERPDMDWLPRMVVHGTLEGARQRLQDLHHHIGLIARYGAEKEVSFPGHNRNTIGRILGDLTDHTLPDLAADVPVSNMAFAVTYPFAKALKDEGVRGHLDNCKAPWLATDTERAVQKKKEMLFGQPGCIPTHPNQTPEDELRELEAVPDQTTWWERHRRADEAAQEARAIAFLQSRGLQVMRAEPAGGVQ